MSDRITTEAIRAEVLSMGMDLVGFAPVERWEHAPFLLSPQAILPGCKTVVVAAIHITDTWTEMGGEPEPQDRSPGGWMDQNSLLDRISYRTVRTLEEHGYNAIGIASSNIWRYRAFEGIPSLFAPDLSHIHAATAAGLAEIGWSGLAITPEFGSRCRFISIVTDAELTPTPMYDGPALCDKCMDCVRHCPSLALKKDMNGKPHRVEIGGKVYEYANKNIWRCAWAEHFNLDLNSKTLQQDHIDETTIMNEIKEKGTRGHERGVCQKYCVPPHLRSDKPSFGRRDKQITQNRINRRYPETMPTLRKMRDDILGKMHTWGAEVLSVQPIDPTSDAAKTIEIEAPGMKTAISFIMRIPAEYGTTVLESDSFSHPAYHSMLDKILHHILLKTARMVEDYGYHAASYGPKLWHADAPSAGMELAAANGLGTYKNGKFISVEFGEATVAATVITDAVLDPTPKTEALPWRADPAPSSKRLRARLESLAETKMASLFGIADAKLFGPIAEDLKKHVNENELGKGVYDTNPAGYCHGEWISKIKDDNLRIRTPETYLPGAKSVIVLGMHFPEALIGNSGRDDTKQIGTYAFWNYQTVYELRFAAVQLALELGRFGYKTVITENLLGVGSRVDSPRGLLPDARCNAIEAMAAGLGQVGQSGALLTEEYGPHQRCICIVTDAPLPTDQPYHGKALCKQCGNCKSRCTMQAITDTTFPVRMNGSIAQIPSILRHRCDWAKRYSLHPDEGPALIGNNTCVLPQHDGEVTIEEISAACEKKDPVMKHRTCILEPCLTHCAAGKTTPAQS